MVADDGHLPNCAAEIENGDHAQLPGDLCGLHGHRAMQAIQMQDLDA